MQTTNKQHEQQHHINHQEEIPYAMCEGSAPEGAGVYEYFHFSLQLL